MYKREIIDRGDMIMEVTLEDSIGWLGLFVLGIFLMSFGFSIWVSWLFIKACWKWIWLIM